MTARSGGGSVKRTSEHATVRLLTSVFIRIAQGVVDAIWLDLGALNQPSEGYKWQMELTCFAKADVLWYQASGHSFLIVIGLESQVPGHTPFSFLPPSFVSLFLFPRIYTSGSEIKSNA